MYGRWFPALCHLFSRVGLGGSSGSFPKALYPLLPVGCNMAMFLMTGSGLPTFCQSVHVCVCVSVSCQLVPVPLAWTRSARTGRTGCLGSVWMCWLLSSSHYSFICTLKTNAVGQDPFAPVWSVAIALLVSPHYCTQRACPVCLLQSESPGLLAENPEGSDCTLSALFTVLTMPRGEIFSS